MSERESCEALLVQHLPFIRRTAAKLCQRHALDPDETDEFVSWTTARLVENDYAALRKFRGESSVTTYLTVVIAMHYRDYRVASLGRWRPSAEARRRGADAVALETLVYRDRYTLADAVAHLRDRGETRLSERELFALFSALPSRPRGRPRPVAVGDPLASVPAAEAADDAVVHADAAAGRARVEQALERAIADLPPEDAVIVRMHFYASDSVAAIARALRVEQKPLYRRLARILAGLRKALEAAGVSGRDVSDLLENHEK